MNLQEYCKVVGASSEDFVNELQVHEWPNYFRWCIKKMNEMYSLPAPSTPSIDLKYPNGEIESVSSRLEKFQQTLEEEIEEIEEIKIIAHVQASMQKTDIDIPLTLEFFREKIEEVVEDNDCYSEVMSKVLYKIAYDENYGNSPAQRLERYLLVTLADWFGDLTVYIRSEALKFGIPLESVLSCIMGSNFTKLGEDGQPVKNENGKVLKGPNFAPPENYIYTTMFENDSLKEEASNLVLQAAEDRLKHNKSWNNNSEKCRYLLLDYVVIPTLRFEF